MAVLADNDRLALWGEAMQTMSARREPIALTKLEILAAVQAADDWANANANAASFNAAIPLPARTALTGRQKAELLMLVIRRRWEVA